MVRRRHSVALVLFGAILAGCAGQPGGESRSPEPSTAAPTVGPSPVATGSAVEATAIRYACDRFPFAPEILTGGPGHDEQADDPAAAALRIALASDGPDFDFLPDTGWHRVGMDATSAEYITTGGDFGVKSVMVENEASGWKVAGWGDCRPRVFLAPGLGAAEWTLDPDQPKPDPATQVITVLVTELSCNSGKPADGRIVGPQVIATRESVLVFFAVRPRPGAQDCPSNPSTRLKVDLGEPLGSRTLLDGGQWPPREPDASDP